MILEMINSVFAWSLMYVLVGIAISFCIDDMKWWMYIPITLFWPLLFIAMICALLCSLVVFGWIEITKIVKRWEIFGSR